MMTRGLSCALLVVAGVRFMSLSQGRLGGALAFSPLPVGSRSRCRRASLFLSSTTTPMEEVKQLQQHEKPRLFPEEVNILYDSKCNVCQWEIGFLRQRDLVQNPGKPSLRFTDLEEKGYNPTDPANGGITYAVGMSSMRGVLPTGRVLTGVPVFRKAYEQVGLGWLFAITKWPVFRELADLAYRIFAKYRTRLTRGGKSVPELVVIYEEQRNALNAAKNSNCDGNASCQKASNEKTNALKQSPF